MPSGDWYCSAASPVRSSTYSLPSGKLSRATSPPCFWNCGTAAGEVLNTRHGALPAVIAAPMTSSDDLPGGDLLGGDLLVGVLRVPGLDHRLAPGDLLGVVRQPDLDGALGAGGVRRRRHRRRRRPRRRRRSVANSRLSPRVVVVLMFIRDPFLLLCGTSGWVWSASRRDGDGGVADGGGAVEARRTSSGGGSSDVGTGARRPRARSRHSAAARPHATASVRTVVSGGRRYPAIGGVVEPGDRQVVRDVQTASLGRRHAGDGHQVVGVDDRGRRLGEVEQLSGGVGAPGG